MSQLTKEEWDKRRGSGGSLHSFLRGRGTLTSNPRMTLNLGRNKAKREARAGKSRKQWRKVP